MTTPTDHASDTARALGAHGAALTALAQDLRAATDVQWEVPPRRIGASEFRNVRIPDPTARDALNPSRLRVRLAVIQAESALARAADSFTAHSEELRSAVAEWQGLR